MGVMPGYAVLPDGTLAANAYFYQASSSSSCRRG
jgi:hypothetical protein